jgi:hypothetical protein
MASRGLDSSYHSNTCEELRFQIKDQREFNRQKKEHYNVSLACNSKKILQA